MKNINDIKKKIIFRCLYSGTKETDLLYKKTIIKNIDTLTFEDMDTEMGKSNLLESLGTSDGFFSCTNTSYSSKSMVDWLGKISPVVKQKIMQSTKTSAAEYDAWKKELAEWLDKETENFKEVV